MGAPSPPVVVRRNFEKFTKIGISPFLEIQNGSKKLRLRGWDPPSENRAVFLRRLAVTKSQMVPRRPIWWQKGWFWGPLGFRAALAHPWAREWGAYMNNKPPLLFGGPIVWGSEQ